MQFEVLMQGEDKTEILTGIYDEYLEKDVGDYFAQPPQLPQGFKVNFNSFKATHHPKCLSIFQLKARNRKEWYLDILRPPYGERKTEIMKLTGF